MVETVATKRPRRLWTAIITLYAQAAINAGVGVLFLYLVDVEADHGRDAPELSVLGFGSLFIAVVLVTCAALLTRGESWARYPIIVIEALGILSGVIAIFSGAFTAVAGIALCVVVLINPLHSDVRLWFDPSSEPTSEQASAGGWAGDRAARVLATSRAAGDPPLSPEHLAIAAQLVHIGPSALSGARNEVQAIGAELDRAGGMPLMRAILHHAEVLSLRQNSISILRAIEMAWDGIGDWRG
jgi:hypothetical protein